MKAPSTVNLHNAIAALQQRWGKRVAHLAPRRMKEICAAFRLALGCDADQPPLSFCRRPTLPPICKPACRPGLAGVFRCSTSERPAICSESGQHFGGLGVTRQVDRLGPTSGWREINVEHIERSAESRTVSDKDSASGARCGSTLVLKQRCNLAMALLAGIRYRGLVVPNSKLEVGAALQKQFH